MCLSSVIYIDINAISWCLEISFSSMHDCFSSKLGLEVEHIFSWEPEGRYCRSKLFHWEPEGRYCHWLCTAMAPFWFSTEHLWQVCNNAHLALNWRYAKSNIKKKQYLRFGWFVTCFLLSKYGSIALYYIEHCALAFCCGSDYAVDQIYIHNDHFMITLIW